jgi:hypothetical protein
VLVLRFADAPWHVNNNFVNVLGNPIKKRYFEPYFEGLVRRVNLLSCGYILEDSFSSIIRHGLWRLSKVI